MERVNLCNAAISLEGVCCWMTKTTNKTTQYHHRSSSVGQTDRRTDGPWTYDGDNDDRHVVLYVVPGISGGL